MNISKILKIVLWLTALHSFLVGMLLIILPASIMVNFGFDLHYNNFFRVQGGVFHVVMSIFYSVAATDMRKHIIIIKLIIIIKFIAALFLILYFFVSNRIITVLLSGIGDLLIGVLILLLLFLFLRNSDNEQL